MRLRLVPLVLCAACGFNTPAGVGMGTDAAIDGDGDAPIDSPIDSSIDGPPADMAMPMCTASGTMDTFQGNTPCDPWAGSDSTNGAMTTQSGGKLRIAGATAATGSTHGGCFATGLSPWGPEGLFIEVEQTLTGANSYTALTAYVATGTPSTIVMENNVIYLRVPGGSAEVSKVYVPSQMRWWRLRPVTGGIVGETSPDALTWNMIGMVSGMPPAMIRIDISAGTSGIQAAPGTAIFDNLDVCP